MKPLTVSFDNTVREYLQDADFRRAYLREGITCMLTGDVETGKLALREYIKFTVGFVQLGKDLGHSPKTLMRMFSASGNPRTNNLFAILTYLQKREGTTLEVIDHEAVDHAA